LSEIQKLTANEQLFLYRRRLGLTQKEMAAKYNLSVKTYQRQEAGRQPTELKVEAPIKVKDLKHAERCVLYRRRCEKTQREVAEEMGMCRYYVNQMELGNFPPDTLLWYWEQ
jgi:DNA-binding XRE family transcriptional regulator